jgi:hypothetical protein
VNGRSELDERALDPLDSLELRCGQRQASRLTQMRPDARDVRSMRLCTRNHGVVRGEQLRYRRIRPQPGRTRPTEKPREKVGAIGGELE